MLIASESVRTCGSAISGQPKVDICGYIDGRCMQSKLRHCPDSIGRSKADRCGPCLACEILRVAPHGQQCCLS